MIPLDPEGEGMRRRQSRAKVMAFALGGFVILMFLITIAKMATA